jgi:ATP synthase protein I
MGKRLNFKEQRTNAEYLALTMQLGLTMAGSIGLGLAIGFYLDRWLGAKGILLVVFILLGVIGGAVTCYRQIMDLEKDSKPPDRD